MLFPIYTLGDKNYWREILLWKWQAKEFIANGKTMFTRRSELLYECWSHRVKISVVIDKTHNSIVKME